MQPSISKLIVTIALIMLATAGGVFWYAPRLKKTVRPAATPSQSTAKLAANLALVEGQVLTQKSGDDRFVEAKEGDTVREQYKVKTGAGARAVVAFDTGDIVRLSENTTVLLTRISSKEVTVNDEAGRVYSRVEHSDTKTYKVVTGSYQTTATGTAFETNYDGTNITTVVTDGAVIDSNGQTLETGKKATVQATEPTKIAIASVEGKDLTNDFTKWNKEQDEKAGKKVTAAVASEKPKPSPSPSKASPKTTSTSLSLKGEKTDSGIKFSWTGDVDAPKGFKIIMGKVSTTPEYPGKAAKHVTDGKTRSYLWEIMDGGTYTFRICIYTGEGCSTYSNTITAEAPKKAEKETQEAVSKVSAIQLSGSAEVKNIKLSWTTSGESVNGFKIVWSVNSGPTYPLRDGDSYHYQSSPTATSDTIENLESGKTYYARVCEYLGGKCGTYSNEVTVAVP